MTSPIEARDYVNGEINRILIADGVIDLLGYKPVIYWQGVSYNNTQSGKISVYVSHNQVKSVIMALGERCVRYTRVAIIEMKVPTSTVNALDKIEALADYLEKELCINITVHADVRLWQAKILNNGVEESHFCITFSQIYTFNDDLTSRIVASRVDT